METMYFWFRETGTGHSDYDRYLEFRYAVFCAELKRVAYTSGLCSSRGNPVETDDFDPFSMHFIAEHKATGAWAACARLIRPSPLGLNVANRYEIFPNIRASLEGMLVGEISRMAIAPQFRRRRSDLGRPPEGDPYPEVNDSRQGNRQSQPELVLGMYREIFHACRLMGIAACYAAMDVRFARLLQTMGFPFIEASPVNQGVNPPRRVYLITASDMIDRLAARDSRILEFMQVQH